MNQVLLYLEFGVFVFLCGLALYFRREGPSGRRIWRLKPSLLFIVAFGLYSSAMPVSRLLGLSLVSENDFQFMLAHLLAAGGIVLGSYFGLRRSTPPLEMQIQALSEVKRTLAVLTVAAGLVLIWRTLYFVGFNPANLLERYRFEQDFFESGALVWDKLLVHIVASVCTFGLIFWDQRRDRLYRFVTFSTLGVVAVILLLRGNRNPFILLALPAIGVLLRHRRLALGWGLVVVFAVYCAFQTIAIVRNVGVRNRAEADVQVAYYDPLRSELGTSYNVWMAARTTPFFDQRRWGATFFVNSLVNLVPASIWPNRPPTAAAELSFYYYEKSGDEVFGLGYSPVLEAYVNFGIVGILPWFGLLILALVQLEKFLEEKGGWGICCWAALLPIAVNAQRIDAAVAAKLYLIFVALFLGLHWCFISLPGSRIGWRLEPQKRVAPDAASRWRISASKRLCEMRRMDTGSS